MPAYCLSQEDTVALDRLLKVEKSYLLHHTQSRDVIIQVCGAGGRESWLWITGLVTKSCLILATPWTVAYQAHLSMGFSRQEYWSGFPFPSPGYGSSAIYSCYSYQNQIFLKKKFLHLVYAFKTISIDFKCFLIKKFTSYTEEIACQPPHASILEVVFSSYLLTLKQSLIAGPQKINVFTKT